MIEQLNRLWRIFERKKIQAGTWPWLHSLLVNDYLEKEYFYNLKDIQLSVDDVLTQIYDVNNETTFESVLQSVEQGGTKALGYVFGLMTRHGAGWHREEVFLLSERATEIFRHLLSTSQTEASIFLNSIQVFHPRASVQGNTIQMNIVKGEPPAINTHRM